MGCVRRQQPAHYRWLEDNARLHMQHGPIDLIVQAEGDASERKQAFVQAIAFFDSVLEDLVAQLAQLRQSAACTHDVQFQSVVARHMLASVVVFDAAFVTPMAAVAGSVADCTLAAMCDGRTLDKVFINNGGDIALYLNAGNSYTVGICENPITADQSAYARIDAASSVRGIATSGWHGRSHSLGIADAVTVLASSASLADTAATLIANQIDLPNSSKVERVAANELSPDSDLTSMPVTVDVKALSLPEKQQALKTGQRYAQSLVSAGLIDSAYMSLQGQRLIAGHDNLIQRRQTA